MKMTIRRKLTEKLHFKSSKTISSPKIQALGKENYSSSFLEKKEKSKEKPFLLPTEARKYQLMAEMDRSMGIEQWTRGRRYQTS